MLGSSSGRNSSSEPAVEQQRAQQWHEFVCSISYCGGNSGRKFVTHRVVAAAKCSAQTAAKSALGQGQSVKLYMALPIILLLCSKDLISHLRV